PITTIQIALWLAGPGSTSPPRDARMASSVFCPLYSVAVNSSSPSGFMKQMPGLPLGYFLALKWPGDIETTRVLPERSAFFGSARKSAATLSRPSPTSTSQSLLLSSSRLASRASNACRFVTDFPSILCVSTSVPFTLERSTPSSFHGSICACTSLALRKQLQLGKQASPSMQSHSSHLQTCF